MTDLEALRAELAEAFAHLNAQMYETSPSALMAAILESIDRVIQRQAAPEIK